MVSKGTLQNWLEEKPFTMALSSGFFGFFAHAGVLKALRERGLKPAAYSGASAGAIIASAAAAGLESRELESLLYGLKRQDFWDPMLGPGLLRGRKFQQLVERHIGSSFHTLRAPLRIATFDVFKRRTETFSQGDLARVVRASAAMPGLFHPVRIGSKLYYDGGILDKMALDGIASGERVFVHYLLDRSFLGRMFDRGPQSRSDHHRFLVLRNLVGSGPTRLHLGPEILESAYRGTLSALTEAECASRPA